MHLAEMLETHAGIEVANRDCSIVSLNRHATDRRQRQGLATQCSLPLRKGKNQTVGAKALTAVTAHRVAMLPAPESRSGMLEQGQVARKPGARHLMRSRILQV
jgi:hypothetical protein